MTYVVTENCIKCKYTDCVEVCPVDCFYEGANMLVIHPDECIDCGACVPVCPTTAIFPGDQLPGKWAEYVEDAMAGADDFKTAEGKRGDLDETAFAG